MQILDPEFEVRLVILPRHAIHARGGFALKRVERHPERIDIDMVEERGELFLLPLPLRLAVRGPAPGSREPGSAPGACFADPRSPWSPALAPPAPSPVARLCSSASSLLCRSQTSLGRVSAATAPHLPAADHPTPNRAYGRSRDLPVPAQGASVHARVSDHAGSDGRSQ